MHPLLLPVLPAGRLLLYQYVLDVLVPGVRGVMVHGSVVDVEFHRVEPSSPWRVLLLLACIFTKSASDKTPFSGHSSHAMIKIYLTIKSQFTAYHRAGEAQRDSEISYDKIKSAEVFHLIIPSSTTEISPKEHHNMTHSHSKFEFKIGWIDTKEAYRTHSAGSECSVTSAILQTFRDWHRYGRSGNTLAPSDMRWGFIGRKCVARLHAGGYTVAVEWDRLARDADTGASPELTEGRHFYQMRTHCGKPELPELKANFPEFNS
ncbi:hypothetical protein FB45DRAFT_876996 [Roridomyces roridus]|uniref:Uncharacterized protein n=1 Tax=Roridomyces roridus TaxID=1738132 RepID=A0AAD7B3N4_9AGAR|nr:hypothetical protein FB45DRAFT_876996 [Roridomyces roridus]